MEWGATSSHGLKALGQGAALAAALISLGAVMAVGASDQSFAQTPVTEHAGGPLAVRNYLVLQYDIDASRLVTAGYGKTQFADPAHSEDGVSRRVQVTNIGDK